MSQYSCHANVVLNCNRSNKLEDEHLLKLEKFLQTTSSKLDDTTLLLEWEKRINQTSHSIIKKWNLFGFAIQLLQRWGKHRLMLAFSIRQTELAFELKNECNHAHNLKLIEIIADSFLNLSKSNFLLSEYKRSLNYAGKCLRQAEEIETTTGNALILKAHGYFYKGKSNFHLSKFKEAIQDFEVALRISLKESDKALECLTCCAMSEFYLLLKDYEKAAFFSVKGLEVLQQHGKDWNTKYRSTVQITLAETYRKIGKVKDAMEACEDAMELALEDQDRQSQAYCMLCFANIHRIKKDHVRSLPRYNLAGGLMVEVGDYYGQSLVAIGRAKLFFKGKEYGKAIAEYERARQLAEVIDCKAITMRIFGEMAILHQRMSNATSAKESMLQYHYIQDMIGLWCTLCNQPIGEKQDQLEILSCFHVFHLICVADKVISMKNKLQDEWICPKCNCANCHN